ncbi:MAG TPA: hypothetical protein VNW97_05410 [Candidatus Saccharimonadales bacterium]|nr:hypothetical protein [Candidatus Saccharimonadales bacterium]
MRSSTRPNILLPLVLLLGFAVALPAQQPPEPSPFDHLPFEQWVREGPREQVPWETRATYLGLSGHQRLMADIEVRVGISALLQRPRQGQMLLLLKVTDSAGNEFRNFESLELDEVNTSEKEAKHESIHFSWKAFFLPGEYRITTALYHSATGEHNVSEKKLRVPAFNKDRLPDVWRNLPAVEFWSPIKKDDLDLIFRPDIEGRLYLPLVTRRPLQVEVLADFAVSDIFHGSHYAYNRYLAAALPTLKTLSQIEVRSGTLDIAVLDLARQRVAFQQQEIKELDWANLKKALAENEASVVSISALRAKHPGPVLFREELMRRISTPGSNTSQAGPTPLRVFILMSSPLGLYSFDGLKSARLPEECSCVIYYLEYDSSRRPGFFSAIGHVKRMLLPQHVHAFSAYSSQGVHHALATILREVAETAER